MINENNEIISTEETCNLLGLSRQTLHKLVEKGEVPGKKIGKQYRFSKQQILDYMHQGHLNKEGYKEWILKGDFATVGIKKMAKRTFQELASNIEELIVNSYDADATLVQVILNQDKRTISIIDDGAGMDESILGSYVIYGESEKTEAYRSPKFGRAPIGEYGMGGKLAITNICNNCKIITRKGGKEHVFNMNRSDLDRAKHVSDIKSKVFTKTCNDGLHGTQVYMEKLFAKHIDSERLYERFSTKMPLSQNFKIILTTINEGVETKKEVTEPIFDFVQRFDYEEDLSLIGKVKIVVFYTKEPIPLTKQGVWIRVNGRIVNEKAEWFNLFEATSGQRYRYRLYGYAEADGLKNYVTFAKNDFVDGPEYKEFWKFGNSCIVDVQHTLLKQDEDVKKTQDRSLIKTVEKQINDVVSQLDNPLTMGNLEAKIKKEFSQEKDTAPEIPHPNINLIEEEASNIANTVKRGKDKRERRNQSLSISEKASYSGKNYYLSTIDLSATGDVIKFTKNKNLIEINEKHQFYIKASKGNYLDSFVRDLAFTEIASDYSDGDINGFNYIFNELARISVQKIKSD